MHAQGEVDRACPQHFHLPVASSPILMNARSTVYDWGPSESDVLCTCTHVPTYRYPLLPYPADETADLGVSSRAHLPLALDTSKGSHSLLGKMTADMGIFPGYGLRKRIGMQTQTPGRGNPKRFRFSMMGRPMYLRIPSLERHVMRQKLLAPFTSRLPPPMERLPFSAGQEQKGKSVAGAVEALQAGPASRLHPLVGRRTIDLQDPLRERSRKVPSTARPKYVCTYPRVRVPSSGLRPVLCYPTPPALLEVPWPRLQHPTTLAHTFSNNTSCSPSFSSLPLLHEALCPARSLLLICGCWCAR